MKIVSICYPLDGDKVELLHFSADAILKASSDSDIPLIKLVCDWGDTDERRDRRHMKCISHHL